MNKYIDSFLDEFSQPVYFKIPDNNYIEAYSNKLPNNLLDMWKKFGFCSFLNGLFSITDPEEYQNVITDWFNAAGISLINKKFHIIAMSGFGDLFVWEEIEGRSFEINLMNGWIIANDSNKEVDLEKQINLFFASKSPYSLDIEDQDTNEEIFDIAVDKLGQLEHGEIFGFMPALITGGEMKIENLQKINVYIYLDYILQLTTPRVVTLDDLKNMTFS